MKTNIPSSLQDAMKYFVPDVRLEVSALIQAFDLEMVSAARK